MGTGEVIGGVALAGVVALLALAIAGDDDPTLSSSNTTVFVWNPSSTSTVTSGSTIPTTATDPQPSAATVSTAASPTLTESSVPPVTSGVSASTAAVETTSAAVTTVPFEERATVAVQVLNGGTVAGSAGRISDALAAEGFTTVRPRDATEGIEVPGRILHAPDHEAAAVTIAALLEWDPGVIAPAGDDDVNWAEFGGDIAVMVIVGPS